MRESNSLGRLETSKDIDTEAEGRRVSRNWPGAQGGEGKPGRSRMQLKFRPYPAGHHLSKKRLDSDFKYD